MQLFRGARVSILGACAFLCRRPKDVEDFQALLAAHPEADVAAVRKWVREFATAASMPDLLSEFDALVAQRRP
jgi:hypothetical protein